MAQVTLSVNGRPYVVGCEDGQEAHLTELARLFDAQVRQVSQDVGQKSILRLLQGMNRSRRIGVSRCE